MPSPTMRIASTVKSGDAASRRNPYRTSCMSRSIETPMRDYQVACPAECRRNAAFPLPAVRAWDVVFEDERDPLLRAQHRGWINATCPQGRQDCRHEPHSRHRGHDGSQCQRIGRIYTEQLLSHDLPRGESQREAGEHAGKRGNHAKARRTREDVSACRSKRQSNAKLARTLDHGGRNNTIDAKSAEENGDSSKQRNGPRVEARSVERGVDEFLHGLNGAKRKLWFQLLHNGGNHRRERTRLGGCPNNHVACLVRRPGRLGLRREDARPW